MRKAIFASATSAVLLHFAPAMLAQVDVKAADLVITERGAHHTAWQYIESRIDALTGQIFDIPRNFTELATGLNFQDESGQWQSAREEFELTPEGALARFGQHKAILANNINSAGAIDLLTPDGVRFRNHPLAIGYLDAKSGMRVTLAVIQDSSGELLAPNKIIYRDAFRGLAASIVYTYSKAGLEADVVLHEAPHPPSDFGLSDRYSRLEIIGELLLDGYVPKEQLQVIRQETDDG